MTVSGVLAVSDYGTQSVNESAAASRRIEQALKSGDLAGAQTTLTTLQQAMQSLGTQDTVTLSRNDFSVNSSSEPSEIYQLYGAVDQAAQSGNLAAADKAYSSLSRELLQFTQISEQQPNPSANDVSVSA
jgi:hypothetical protein